MGSLRRQNQELAKLLVEREPPAADFEPSSSWADSGSGTPEAAAATFAWAIKAGNKDRLAQVLMWEADPSNTNLTALVEDLSGGLRPLMSEVEASRLVFKDNPAPDEVTFWFQSRFKDGQTLVSPLKLKRSGDQWKVEVVVGGNGAGN